MARRRGEVSASRVLGDGEDPISWAPTVGSLFGIRIRVHVLFIVLAGYYILTSISRDGYGALYSISAMASLFLLVLLHEFGHCFAARWVGGDATQIVLWPLGGLASVHVPQRWLPNLIVALGGPAVNALLAPVFALALWAAGAREAILFNPFDLGATLAALPDTAQVLLFWAHAVNLLLLGFNLLLPVFPMDGGRVLQAILWRSMGWRASMSAALAVGIAGSIALGVFGAMSNRMLLIAIAAFTGLTCWAERRRLSAMDAMAGGYGGDGALEGGRRAHEEARAEQELEARRRAKAREAAAREQAEEDRILAKIASEGMQSLTRAERKTLERATAKRRGG